MHIHADLGVFLHASASRRLRTGLQKPELPQVGVHDRIRRERSDGREAIPEMPLV